MGFLIRFAWRNLGRHRRRTLITAGALAVGLAIFLFTDSMLRGADADSERNLVWYETGAAKVVTPLAAGQPDKLSLKDPLTDGSQIAGLVRSQGYAATLRTSFEAEITTQGTEDPASQLVKAVAIDPANDGQVFSSRGVKLTGRWFGPGDPAVVLGTWLAADLHTAPGQRLTLTTRTREGSYQVLDLDVVGTIDSPDPVVNRTGVFLPLEFVDEQLGMAGDVTEVTVGWAPGNNAQVLGVNLETVLRAAGHNVRVLTWRDLARDFLAIAASKQKGSALILFLVFVIAAVGVGNTFLLAFYERKTEIGMLRALGMPDKSLLGAFLIEAAGIGAVGSVLGLTLGALSVAWLTTFGLDFSVFTRTTDIGYRISGAFYGTWSPGSFALAGLFGVVLSALCVIGPTRRALGLSITESLRSE